MTPGVKERPILFNGPMVRAILDGRKTQTRRLVKPQPFVRPWQAANGEVDDAVFWRFGEEREDWPSAATCPYGAPGDRLWVREAWKSSTYSCDDEPTSDDHECSEHCEQTLVYYAATPRVGLRAKPDGARMRYLDDSTPLSEWYERGWRPSIHMPRWASRITLEVTDVRVERLRIISDADARAEGVDGHEPCGDFGQAVSDFRKLWDSINGERAPWSTNPWVWVVGFRRLP